MTVSEVEASSADEDNNTDANDPDGEKIPQLSSGTLAALKEFYAEQDQARIRFEKLKLRAEQTRERQQQQQQQQHKLHKQQKQHQQQPQQQQHQHQLQLQTQKQNRATSPTANPIHNHLRKNPCPDSKEKRSSADGKDCISSADGEDCISSDHYHHLPTISSQEFDPVIRIEDFSEDWNQSQFWYNDQTATTFARNLLLNATATTAIAVVSAPSVFVKIKEILQSSKVVTDLLPTVTLFEFDRRFSLFGADFVFYDFNHPTDLPKHLKAKYDRVIVDPPFLSAECQTKAAKTVQWLLSSTTYATAGAALDKAISCADHTTTATAAPHQKLIVCTGERMKDLVLGLYGPNHAQFHDEHDHDQSQAIKINLSHSTDRPVATTTARTAAQSHSCLPTLTEEINCSSNSDRPSPPPPCCCSGFLTRPLTLADFHPEHTRGLSNDFLCFSNFPIVPLLSLEEFRPSSFPHH